MKVTPFAGTSGYSHAYGRRWGRWEDPQRKHERFKAQRAAYFRKHAPATIADAGWRVLTVAGSGARWFRLVDVNGKPYGRRLRRLGPTRDADGWHCRWDYLCADQHGRELWISGFTRARHVDQQPEDYHSYASRVLTRAHKQED